MENNETKIGGENESDYVEEQMIEASALLTEKGYRIGTLAGDYGRMVDNFAENQAMLFDFPPESYVTQETWTELRKLGVRQFSGAKHAGLFGIEFSWMKKTQPPEQLKNKWLEIARVLPVATKEK